MIRILKSTKNIQNKELTEKQLIQDEEYVR